jgi:hypothetical protein
MFLFATKHALHSTAAKIDVAADDDICPCRYRNRAFCCIAKGQAWHTQKRR